jgi:hypothetical protein
MSRDTTTGLKFEEQVQIQSDGINLSKHKLYAYLEKQGIDYRDIISRKILPDECYLVDDSLRVYEKKFQQTGVSADEKPQTCGFKIQQFRKIGAALGIKPEDVSYTYVFNDWFQKPEYKDMLDYIKSVDGCDYFFA